VRTWVLFYAENGNLCESKPIRAESLIDAVRAFVSDNPRVHVSDVLAAQWTQCASVFDKSGQIALVGV